MEKRYTKSNVKLADTQAKIYVNSSLLPMKTFNSKI